MLTKTPDFSRPIEADFIVALKTKNGAYDLFVEAFTRKNGKAYLKHTKKVWEAKRFSKLVAQDVAQQVEEYRCTGRVERVSPNGETHEPIKKIKK